MEKFDANPVSEQYRSSLSERLLELDKNAGNARKEVLKNIKKTPLYALMKSIHRGVEVDDFDEKRIVGLMAENEIISDDESVELVQSFLESGEKWEDYKQSNVQEKSKVVANKSLENAESEVSSNKLRTNQEIGEQEIKHNGLEQEFQRLESTPEAEIVKALSYLGYNSQHITPEQKLNILKGGINHLPVDLAERVRQLEKSKSEASIFTKLFSKHSREELALLGELNTTIPVYLDGKEQIGEAIRKSGEEIEAIKSKYPADGNEIFSRGYSNDLLKSILEQATGSSIEKAGSLSKQVVVLKKQNIFARKLSDAYAVISEPDKFLSIIGASVNEDGEAIGAETESGVRLTARITEIDQQIEVIECREVQTADDVAKKLSEIKKLKEEKERHLSVIGSSNHRLVQLYEAQGEKLSSEAIMKSISNDRALIEKVKSSYEQIANEMFGVPIDRLEPMITAQEGVIEGLEKEVIKSINKTIAENTSGSDAAYDAGKLSEFLSIGGSAVEINVAVRGSVYCTKGEGRFDESDRYRAKRMVFGDDEDYKYDAKGTIAGKFPNLSAEIFNKKLERRYKSGNMMGFNGTDLDGKVWFPIGNIDQENLSSALEIYSQNNSYSGSRESNGCDVYSASLRVRAEIKNGQKKD